MVIASGVMMKSFIQNQKGFFSLVFIFSCTILGAVFSSSEHKLLGSAIGLVSSSLISYFIISPDIKLLYSALISKPNIDETDVKKTGFNFTIDYHNFLWHPTRIPILIGAFWFIFIGSAQSSAGQKVSNPDQDMMFILIPLLFLIGVSGLIKLLKGESVNKFGKIQQGTWAYVSGTISILIGWGGFLFFILAHIFKW